MATENNSAEDLQAEKLDKARKANEARNQSRLERLSAIADGADQAHAGEMKDTPSGDLVLKGPDNPEEREAAAAQEELDAERYLAEQQAKALQEEGAASEEEAIDASEERKEQAVATKDDAQDVKVINGVTHYLTVINGKEKWLTLAQLRTTAQKVESADEYLAAASASVRNSARLALSPEDETDKVEEVDLEKTLSSAVLGDQEAIKKLASVIKEAREAKAKPSGVTPDVLQQIDERWSFRRAAEWFDEEYADLLTDPNLKRLVYERDSELAKATPTMPYRQRLKAAGDEIRGWKQKLSGVRVVPSKDKSDRKKELVNVPSASARQTPVVDEEAEESVEDVIGKMAKARGQARAIVHRGTTQR